ncbi:MAG TPA: cell division protein SepF [Dermatophilaceae bacterium]|jgi:cell division inhibitor SepF
MAGALRKTMVYLGLAEDPRDDAYEAYDDYDEAAVHQDAPDRHERSAAVTPLPTRTPVARVVRDVEVGALNRISTIHPRTYNEAKNIGESFREGTPVIMNLTDLDDADAKRLVDFAAGLVFGLHGSIERVTSKVFLLSPAHVEVTANEVAPPKAASRGFFNQS